MVVWTRTKRFFGNMHACIALGFLSFILGTFCSNSNCASLVMASSENNDDSSLPSAWHVPTFALNDGHFMPRIGIGTHQCAPGDETWYTVTWALELGVRLVDTAASYNNEETVGKALKDFYSSSDARISRENVYVTTKLNSGDHGFVAAYAAAEFALSKEKLDMEYIDLFLIHSPYGGKIVETWDAFIQLHKDGLVRSIGVSNFGISHLEAIRQAGRPMPAVNQIELHPLNYKKRQDLIDYCRQHQIVITAYGSLFYGHAELYQHNHGLELIAKKYGKTVPQVLLRWALDKGFAIIPKSSSSKERQAENFDVLDFTLTTQELETIENLPGELNAYWNPIDNAPVDIGDLDLAERVIREREAYRESTENEL